MSLPLFFRGWELFCATILCSGIVMGFLPGFRRLGLAWLHQRITGFRQVAPGHKVGDGRERGGKCFVFHNEDSRPGLCFRSPLFIGQKYVAIDLFAMGCYPASLLDRQQPSAGIFSSQPEICSGSGFMNSWPDNTPWHSRWSPPNLQTAGMSLPSLKNSRIKK